MAKLIMDYTYRSSNGVFSGAGRYTCKGTMNVPVAIDEIRRGLHLDTPYGGVEIIPIAFSAEDDSPSTLTIWLLLFLVIVSCGIVAAVVNTLIQSALR